MIIWLIVGLQVQKIQNFHDEQKFLPVAIFVKSNNDLVMNILLWSDMENWFNFQASDNSHAGSGSMFGFYYWKSVGYILYFYNSNRYFTKEFITNKWYKVRF